MLAEARELVWVRPGRLSPARELRAGREVLVTLPWLGWGGRPWPLRLADGQPLEWAATGRHDREFVFRSPDGRALVRFTRALLEQQYRPDGRRELWVAVTENGRALRELPLLVLLGRYLAR